MRHPSESPLAAKSRGESDPTCMASMRRNRRGSAPISSLVFFSCFLLLAPEALSAQTSGDANLLANPVYQRNCAKCHGKTAEGRHFGGPSLISEKIHASSNDDLRNLITNGKGRMPKYTSKLSPEEINTLVQQIKALSRQ